MHTVRVCGDIQKGGGKRGNLPWAPDLRAPQKHDRKKQVPLRVGGTDNFAQVP